MSLLRALFAAFLLLAAGTGWMMQTDPEEARSNAAAWLDVFGLSSWGEGFTPATDSHIMAGVIAWVVLVLGAWIAYEFRRRRKKSGKRKLQRRFTDFDMPIEAAIDHIVDSTHHSFTRSSLAERNAFEQLHKAMCAGLLPVIGKLGESAVPRKISPRRCKKLQRREMATPHGMRFHLTEKGPFKKVTDELKKDSPVFIKKDDLFGFGELRVRSKDLYGIWPLNLEERGGE